MWEGYERKPLKFWQCTNGENELVTFIGTTFDWGNSAFQYHAIEFQYNIYLLADTEFLEGINMIYLN